MPHSRYAARKDNSHAEIAATLESYGIHVMDTSRLGGGFPDLLGYGRHRILGMNLWIPVECKTRHYTTSRATYAGKPTRQGPRFTKAQLKALADSGVQIPVCENGKQALALWGIL